MLKFLKRFTNKFKAHLKKASWKRRAVSPPQEEPVEKTQRFSDERRAERLPQELVDMTISYIDDVDPVEEAQGFSEEQQAVGLPQELVDTIISYIYDVNTLCFCSMTCRSWYSAAVPRLHYSLTTINTWNPVRNQWPKPLQGSYELGLLGLVKRFSILDRFSCLIASFTPERLDGCNLRYFSALVNLRELRIEGLQLPGFIPNIGRCFGHLAPRLESLALSTPDASCRQILYLIGHFPRLQNFELRGLGLTVEDKTSLALVLPPTPPLCGRLTLKCLAGEKFARDIIAFSGGLRFRCLCLEYTDCALRILDACVETLETLRLCPDDRNDFYSDLDLSRYKSLRTLEISVELFTNTSAYRFLRNVLPTIASPPSLHVVIVYDRSFQWTAKLIRSNHSGDREACLDCRIPSRGPHESLCEISKAWNFQLVYCIEVPEREAKYALRGLELDLEAQKKKEPDSPLSKSLIISRIPPV